MNQAPYNYGARRPPQQRQPPPRKGAKGVQKGGKKSKRQYIGLERPILEWPAIINKDRTGQYRDFIIDLLESRGNVRRSEGAKYTDEAGMDLFIRAMTHDSVNPMERWNNYEMLEHIGDTTVNKSITWYLKSRFPEIYNMGDTGVVIMSKQEGMLKSKPFLAKYSEKLGFPSFIRYRPLEFEITKENKDGTRETGTKRVNLDQSMKEDVFESFFGCLEDVIDNKEGFPGVGYSVCFRILSSIFDEEEIPTSLADLVDDKTKLKEVLDKRKPVVDRATKQIVEPGDKWEWINQNKEITLLIHLGYNRDRPITLQYGPISTSIIGEDDAENSSKQIAQQLAKDALADLIGRFGDEYAYRK